MDLMRSLIAVLLLVVSQSVLAGVVTDLYRVTLPVSEQAPYPSDDQISVGLSKVLLKVSGSSQIATDVQIQQQMQAPASTLKQFSYAIETDGIYLILDYHQSIVDDLVSRTGIKPLGAQRPTVLFWMASDISGDQDYLLARDPIHRALLQAAKLRGLPLQFPLFDLEDQLALPVTDLWGLFDEPVDRASLRYKPDAVVAGRITNTASAGVNLEWRFVNHGKSQRFTESGASKNVAEAVINRIADQLFQPVVSHDLSYFQTGVAVKVENISNLADYIQLVDFLKSLPVVSQVKPERAIGKQITVRLELDGSESQLRQAISLEPRLQALDSQRNQDGSAVFIYRWQG